MGLLIGFSLRMFIFALQTAGTIISQTLSLAQLFTPMFSADAETPYGTFLVFAAITLALISGMHVKVIILISETYTVFPFALFPDAAAAGQWIIKVFVDAFALAFQFAMPFIITALIYNLAIGAANRAMPQLLASLVGAPAITWAGLIMFALTVPALLQLWMQKFDQRILDIAGGAG